MSSESRWLGAGIPYVDTADLKGTLIVIEGTDGVGRSSQIAALKQWLEVKGYAVATTGWTRSPLMGKAIQSAKAGHRLNVNTFSLLYAADFADRLEHEVIPALKAGFVVLADRYVYTAFARGQVRGASRDWIRKVFGFALKPDAVFYMKTDVENLIPRVIGNQILQGRTKSGQLVNGMDFWESGMDLHLGEDFYDSFVEYQRRVLAEFDAMAGEFGFSVVNATRSFDETHRKLKERIAAILENDKGA